jgi:imidazolonepropionase-like amidohydrolase
LRATLIGVRFALWLLACVPALSQTLLIRNVTVVDVNGARPSTNVLIRNGRIAALGAIAPRGVQNVDGTGKFLMPGLWDMHVHLWESDPMLGLYVASGVLGVRDMGSDIKRTREMRADIAAGRRVGPLIYTPGPMLDGPNSGVGKGPVIKVDGPEDGRRAVDRVDESLADFVKVMSELSLDAYEAIAQRARVRRIPFAGHLPEAVPVMVAVNARQKSIEHLFGLALACSLEETHLLKRRADAIAKKDYAALREVRDRTYATFNPAIAVEVFRQMARYGVWQTPTLTLRKRLSLMGLEELTSAPELKYVPEAIRSGWNDPREEFRKATPEQLANFREDYEFHRKLMSYIRSSGTGILAGTDTGDPYVVPGFALHDELVLLVEAGLSPAEALASATVQPARYFGIEEEYGTVERGRIANLVLLHGNPLDDIHNTRRIAAVIQKGRLLPRKCLDDVLAGRQDACALVASPRAPASAPVKRRPARRTRGSRSR